MIALVIWALRNGIGSRQPPPQDPLDILRRRLAEGSITVEEYEQRRAKLTMTQRHRPLASGRELLDLPTRWRQRSGELIERYRDLPLGLVDATVIAATEMLGETKLATLDHRHFTVVRPAHAPALELLP